VIANPNYGNERDRVGKTIGYQVAVTAGAAMCVALGDRVAKLVGVDCAAAVGEIVTDQSAGD
jgi:hypothetical protein